MNTKVLRCSCDHDYQDKAYGYKMRLHNWARKAEGTGAWRCTVCGKTRKDSTIT